MGTLSGVYSLLFLIYNVGSKTTCMKGGTSFKTHILWDVYQVISLEKGAILDMLISMEKNQNLE